MRDIKAEYVNALKGISEDEFSGIGGLIDAEASKLKNIDDLINAGRIKKDISELSGEIRNNLFDGLQNVYGLAKNLGNAFLNIKDTFADSDATFFEKLISVFDALFSTINGVMSVMQTIESISTLTDTLSQAKAAAAGTEIASIGAIAGAKVAADTTETTSALAKSAAVVTALSAEEAAATGVMAAKSAAAYASIPFAGGRAGGGTDCCNAGLNNRCKDIIGTTRIRGWWNRSRIELHGRQAGGQTEFGRDDPEQVPTVQFVEGRTRENRTHRTAWITAEP